MTTMVLGGWAAPGTRAAGIGGARCRRWAGALAGLCVGLLLGGFLVPAAVDGAATNAVPGAAGTNGVRLLVVTGGHEHEPSFYSLFEGYADLPGVLVSDLKIFEHDLRGRFDVVVLYNFVRELDGAVKTHLEEFVAGHKGIVVLHHGILNFQNSPWWYEEVAGGLYRLETRGGIPNSTVAFGQHQHITFAGDHPITRGLEPFPIVDETYKGLFISPKVQPLLFTDSPASDRVVGWVGPCTTSRVVFFQLGHDHVAFGHPSYRALVHRAILWTAGKLD